MKAWWQKLIGVVVAAALVVVSVTWVTDAQAQAVLWSLATLVAGWVGLRRPGDTPPPKSRDPLPPGTMLTLSLATAAVVSGCGASALEQHATALTVSRAVIDASADVITAERYAALEDAAVRGPVELADAKQRWAPVVEAHALAVTAWLTWRDTVQRLLEAEAAGEEVGAVDLAPLAGRVGRLYERVRSVAALRGLELPRPPDLLHALLPGRPDATFAEAQ